MGKNIESLLYSAGVSQCYVGYRYFISAVTMAAEDMTRLSNIHKEIYIPLSKQYGTSYYNIEKNIRTIRTVFLRNNGKVILEKMTGCRFCHDNLPFPKEMIEIFANYMRKP